MQTQLINFTIPKLLLKNVDVVAKRRKSSRSELLREAVRNYLDQEAIRKNSFEAIRGAAERNNLSEAEVNKLVEEATAWARRRGK